MLAELKLALMVVVIRISKIKLYFIYSLVVLISLVKLVNLGFVIVARDNMHTLFCIM